MMLLGYLHDLVGQLSRLQRIHPYALWNADSSARPRNFYPEPSLHVHGVLMKARGTGIRHFR